MLNSTQINTLKIKIQDVIWFITLNYLHKKEFDFSSSLSKRFRTEMELLERFLENPNPEQALIEENSIRYKNVMRALATNETIHAKLGVTALHKAAATNNTVILLALLAAGADIEKRSRNQMTALSYAAYWNCTDTTKVLIQEGADVNSRDELENTPLIWATLSKGNKTIQAILDCTKVDKMARNYAYDTALRMALDEKSSKEAHQLIFQAIKSFPTPNASTTFHVTARKAPITLEKMVSEIVTLVREIQNEPSPLSFIQPLPLGFIKNIETLENWLKLFLDSDRDENRQEMEDIFYKTITLLATDQRFDCHVGLTPLMFAARYYLNIAVHMLIKAGANIDRVSKEHGTAFGNAAVYGNVDALLTLQQSGADINLPDGTGRTPLIATIEPLHEESLKLLIGFPALDVAAKNGNGETALILIEKKIFKYEVAEMLKERAVKDYSNPLTFSTVELESDDWSRPLWRGTSFPLSSEHLLLLNAMISFLDKLITTDSASPIFSTRTLPAFSTNPPMKDEHSDRHQSAQNQRAFDRCYGLTVSKK